MNRRRYQHVCSFALAVLLAVSFAGSAPFAADKDDAKRNKADSEEMLKLLRLFADTLDQVDRNYVKDISRRELMEAAIEGMITKLDQYSNYIPPEQLEQFRSGVESEFGGVGIQVSVQEGQLTVISPLIGTPAYRAGLHAGDKIVEIEGESTKDITLNQAVQKIKGKVGTSVELTVLQSNNKRKTVSLMREIVRVETVLGDRRNKDDSWNFYLDEKKKIGYVRVNSFGRHTTDDLRKAIVSLQKDGMKGLILDLRFNPGGLLSAAIEVSDMFVSDGKIVSTSGRNSPERVWNAHKKDTFEGFPIAVMINRFSASASEIVSACLKDHDRAIVVGERSWGKGSVQNIIELESGKSALKLTTAGYLRPNGKNIHRFKGAKDSDDWGVKPSDGFRLRLPGSELSELMTWRRDRDILRENGDVPESEFVDRQLARAVTYIEEKTGQQEKEEDKDKKEAAKEDKEKTEPAADAAAGKDNERSSGDSETQDDSDSQ